MNEDKCCGYSYMIRSLVIEDGGGTPSERFELLDNDNQELLDNDLNEYLDNA